MATVRFIATTLTSKGRFGKGESSNAFTEAEAKDLQRLSSVESPKNPTVKKVKKKKVAKDESKDISEK